MTSTSIGKRGEHLACRFLESKKIDIVARNWRLGKGEIDIIGKDKDTLVFVEVKYRRSLVYGEPEEALTRKKQEMLRAAITGYIVKHRVRRFRVDVVAVLEMGGKVSIRLIKDILLLQ